MLFDRMTPHQFAALFFKPGAGRPELDDPIELLRLANLERAKKGLKPVIPHWL